MKTFLLKPIIATIAITLFACSGDGSSSSPENEISEAESSSSNKDSSDSSEDSSSSKTSKVKSSDSKGKSSSSGATSSSQNSGSSSSSADTNTTPYSFSYIREWGETIIDLQKMQVTDKRDGHVYDIEIHADSSIHMIQPINYEIPDQSWCFNDYAPNCEKYGRLYKWGETLKNSNMRRSCSPDLEDPCPSGWSWSSNGTKGFYAGYRNYDGEYLGFGEVQMYWTRSTQSTMETNQTCDESVYVTEFCRDSTKASCYSSYGKTLYRNNATYIHCRCGLSIIVPDSITLPKSTYEFPKYDTTKISQEYAGTYGEIIDERDGNIYKTVKIGEQTWMAENLKFAIDSSWCHSRDCEANENLGRYYAWVGANNYSYKDSIEWPVQGVCPEGWHIPTREEWETLFKYVLDITGGHSLAKSLMTAEAWGAREHGGYNTFGFNIRPTGEVYCYNWRVVDDALHFSKPEVGAFFMVSGNSSSLTSVKFENPDKNKEPSFYTTTGNTRVYPSIRCIEGKGSRGIFPKKEEKSEEP